ncbi:MAG TPA: DUF899 family protein [Thermoanaerobaculia bacterium]|nr:DUF899 family protein [Thermoanaerobaculia bacterium]
MAVQFPNESDSYRAARNALLESEKELRRRIESVAAERRALPVGGATPEDYAFDSDEGPVRMSSLFGDRDTLVIYSFMYGPAMAQPCTSCTSILDALEGEVPHIVDRVPFVAVARSPIDRIREFAQTRGWRNLRLLSSANNAYNRDYRAEDEKGAQWPALTVFVRRDGQIHHSYSTELLYATAEPGQDGRHVDMIWPLWNVFDYTPEGRGTDWYPKLKY